MAAPITPGAHMATAPVVGAAPLGSTPVQPSADSTPALNKKPVRRLKLKKPGKSTGESESAAAPAPAPAAAPIPAPLPSPVVDTPGKAARKLQLKKSAEEAAPEPAPAQVPPAVRVMPGAAAGVIAPTPPPEIVKSPLFPNATSGLGRSSSTASAIGSRAAALGNARRTSVTGDASAEEYAPDSLPLSHKDHDGPSTDQIMYSNARMLALKPGPSFRVEMPAGAVPFTVEVVVSGNKKSSRTHGRAGRAGASTSGNNYRHADEKSAGQSTDAWDRSANKLKPRDNRGRERENRRGRGRGGGRGRKREPTPPPHIDNVQEFLGSNAESSFSSKRQQDVSEDTRVIQTVTSNCNKMSRDNFDKLLVQTLELPIRSFALMQEVVYTIFDKALDNTFFQDLYADMVAHLAAKSDEIADKFLVIDEHPDGRLMYNTTGIALGAMNEDELRRAEKKRTVGALPAATLEAYEARGDWNVDAHKRELRRAGKSQVSFQRMLLNTCGGEFKKWPGDFRKFEASRESKKAEGKWDEELEAKYQARREEFFSEYATAKRRRRFLALISFVGHLYMLTDMVATKVLNDCLNTLLEAMEPETPAFRADALEAMVHLLLLVGQRLEAYLAGKGVTTGPYFAALDAMRRLSKHPKLEKRLQFKCIDVMEARDNNWTLSENHAANFKKILTVEEFRKQDAAKAEKKAAEVQELMARSGGLGQSRHARGGRGFAGGDPRGKPRNLGPSGGLMSRGASSGGAAGKAGNKWLANYSVKGKGKSGGASPAAAPAKPAVDLEKLTKSAVGILEEYAASKDEAEMTKLIKALPKHGGAGMIAGMLSVLQGSAKPPVLDALPDVVAEAAEQGVVKPEDLPVGLERTARKFRELKTDSPKLASYVAEVVAPFVESGAVTLSQVLSAVGHHQAQMAGAAVEIVARVITELPEGKVDVDDVKKLPWMETYGPGGFQNAAKDSAGAVTGAVDCPAPADDDESQLVQLWRLGQWRDAARDPAAGAAAWTELPSTYQRSAALGAAAVVELVSQAASMGMGGTDGDGKEDIEELNTWAPTLDAIKASVPGKEELASRVLEGVARVVATEEMYEDTWRAGLFLAFVKALQKAGMVSKADVKAWAAHPLAQPLNWAHADAVAALKGKGVGL